METKQALVTADGTKVKKRKNSAYVPNDSELSHSDFYLCLEGLNKVGIEKLLILWSGVDYSGMLRAKRIANKFSFNVVEFYEDFLGDARRTGAPFVFSPTEYLLGKLDKRFFFVFGDSVFPPEHYVKMDKRKREWEIIERKRKPKLEGNIVASLHTSDGSNFNFDNEISADSYRAPFLIDAASFESTLEIISRRLNYSEINMNAVLRSYGSFKRLEGVPF
ncbi:MAG: hypothetical protein AABX28_00910 [Nanoarchaeota archaeon]